jgi:VWFA-related protein
MRRALARLLIAGLFVPVLYASSAAPARAVPALAPVTRTVYVAVFDSKGVPVTDLTAADFSVKEGGKDYEITKAEAATGPLQVVVIADDNGVGVFRPAVAAFIQALSGKAQFEIMTVIDRVQRSTTDFTSDTEALKAAIAALAQRPGARDGSVLLDAVSEAARDLNKRKAERPVIVALSIAGTERSSTRAGQVLTELKTSRALLHVISLGNALVQANSSGQASEDTVNLNDGLDNGTKQSGGRRNQISAITDIQSGLQKILDQVTHQYALSYTLPDGVKLNERFAVTVKRPGAIVMAPAKIPDK